MTGASAPVIHAAGSPDVLEIPGLMHQPVDMAMTGRPRCETHSWRFILIVVIRLVCMDPKSLLL